MTLKREKRPVTETRDCDLVVCDRCGQEGPTDVIRPTAWLIAVVVGDEEHKRHACPECAQSSVEAAFSPHKDTKR